MNEAVHCSEKKVRVISVDLLEDVETEASEVAKKIWGSVEECLEENDGVNNLKGKIEASSEDFELEDIELWADLARS